MIDRVIGGADLLLDTAGCQAGLPVTLQEEEDRNDRDDR